MIEPKKKLLLIVILLGVYQPLFCQNWLNEIIPTKTSVVDLKRMFNVTPTERGKDELIFKLDEGNIIVFFSLGGCIDGTAGRWNVAPETVIDLTFYPAKRKSLKRYDLPATGMTQGLDHGHKTFTSKELGLYYSVEFGKLSGVSLFPAAKYEHLRCDK